MKTQSWRLSFLLSGRTRWSQLGRSDCPHNGIAQSNTTLMFEDFWEESGSNGTSSPEVKRERERKA